LVKRAYLTTLGRSTWALVNTYYAVLREIGYLPDRVYIFTEQTYESNLLRAKAAIEILSEEFDIDPEIETKIVSDWDFLAAGKEVFTLVKTLKTQGAKVAIDITPGRKALVVASLITGIKIKIDHVFYLAIKYTDNAAKPYMMIPLQIQQIRDFMADAKEVIG
jgi:hypothetical protein